MQMPDFADTGRNAFLDDAEVGVPEQVPAIATSAQT